jgi:hypothetical protein
VRVNIRLPTFRDLVRRVVGVYVKTRIHRTRARTAHPQSRRSQRHSPRRPLGTSHFPLCLPSSDEIIAAFDDRTYPSASSLYCAEEEALRRADALPHHHPARARSSSSS